MLHRSLLVIAFILSTNYSIAQQVKVGVSAGLVRSFVYVRNHSTKGVRDYVYAEGQLGYMLNAKAERALTPKTSLDVGLRFLRTSTYYDVALLAPVFNRTPASFETIHTWRAVRHTYALSTGLSRAVWKRGNKKVRVFAGFLAGLETQRLQLDRTEFTFYDNAVSNIAVDFDYSAQQRPAWLCGAEAGFGLRLFDGVDLNLRYNYDFTKTPTITYNSVITYDGAADSPRQSVGRIRGRPTCAG
ncbi:hypothetical protein ACW9KT_15945 [Hymenobacter sp. HD11105]